MKKHVAVMFTSIALLAGGALADDAHHGGAKPAAQAAAPMAEGEVRKIDKDNKRITLKHGEIKNLDMPGMTMVFRVRDPALLDKVQPGTKVRFSAEKDNGNYIVTELEPAS